jgi:hypothetical protein
MMRRTDLQKAGMPTANAVDAKEPNGVPNSVERERRFSVRMPVYYRLNGEKRWQRGTTENVSRSGALFRGELTAAPGTSVELRMLLPSEVSLDGGAQVICSGTIVRALTTPAAERLPFLATTISHYRLVRP